ncbi:efflux RND transporter periplasmic adaptor subunit [Parabacteroides sp. Marseille-P3160]|uniref:efflux RND transporter periplasmic adaptor subunit n=1 Tax=Parabacteroides sp. Marseille-P3160 TaxID=1917887 RepID=UPI0009BB2156|nr:efflux RND transporter periplasmic adaptor subunit [Parabacteroides sp. Marseille-P3160]
MAHRTKWVIIGAILLLIVGMIAYPYVRRMMKAKQEGLTIAPSSKAATNQRTLNINAEVLRHQTLTDKIISTGSTIPDEEVDLSFEASGKIVAIHFKEGTHVHKGELLAKINDAPLQAQLKKLEAQLPLAKDRMFRQRTLLERDAVSQEAFEQVSTEYEKLMADIDLVKANIAQTELRAPFDGVIGLRFVSEGAYTSPTTVIAKLTKISPLKIEFSVPESYASEVKEGTSIIFRMLTSGGLMNEYKATIYAVESIIEESTRSLKVRARYPNPGEHILPGRYASIEIMKREIKDALTIPSEALIPEMGKDIVYLYRNGVAQPVEIIIGLRTESRLQVLQGVSPGDTLITSGVMQLRTGMPVSIENMK